MVVYLFSNISFALYKEYINWQITVNNFSVVIYWRKANGNLWNIYLEVSIYITFPCVQSYPALKIIEE